MLNFCGKKKLRYPSVENLSILVEVKVWLGLVWAV